LIDEQRQVAIALHPACEGVADDRLRRRPHDERLLELARRHELAVRSRLEPVMSDDGTFLGEAFDVRRFLLQERQRDEQREVGVLVPRRLEHVVERPLHVFPQRVAPGPNDHAAADRRILGEIGAGDDLLIPLRVVLGARRRDGGSRFVHKAGKDTD
jgi:hypothetical protein